MSQDKNYNPIFFICEKCKLAAFEEPYYSDIYTLHKKCSDFAIEKRHIARQIKEEYDPTKQMAKIFFDSNTIVIDHPFNAKLNDIYRKFYGFKWNKEKRRREIKKDKVNSLSANFLLREIQFKAPEFNWQKDEDVKDFLNEISPPDAEKGARIKQLNELKKNFNADIDLSHLKIEPYGYQKAGIAFLESINGVGLIGDEMGLGKTLTALGYSSKHNFKTIVVTLASLKYNWKKEIENFTYKTAIVIDDDSTVEQLKTYDYVIVNYEQLQKRFDLLKKLKFNCVILDESHYIANISSGRTKNVFKLFKNIPHRIELSGTPSKNRPMELYSQLKFLKPEEFPNKQDFGFRYCGATQGYNGFWEFKGASNLDELNERIAPFYIRRLKSEVLKDLPEKRISNVIFELDSATRKEYNKLVTGLREESGVKNLRNLKTKDKEAKLIQLMKFCSQQKVNYVIDYVKTLLQEDPNSLKKVIIFAHFQDTQKLLKKHFDTIAVSLMGEDSDIKRQEVVDKFQNDPNVRIFIGSTKAAGTGITLTAADTVIFADLLWTPADLKQAEDRAHRIGQENNVFVYYFTFSETVEDIVWKTLQKKLIVVGQTVGDIPFNEEEMINDLIDKVFAEK